MMEIWRMGYYLEIDIRGNADCVENDKGALVDLYIPRHCSATSMSNFYSEDISRWSKEGIMALV